MKGQGAGTDPAQIIATHIPLIPFCLRQILEKKKSFSPRNFLGTNLNFVATHLLLQMVPLL